MGTDIKLHIEVKIENEWRHYAQLRPDRNYLMFSLMAGECGNETSIAQPRGLPKDLTYMTARHAKDPDGYSHSWLSRDEIGILASKYAPRRYDYFEEWVGAYLYGNTYTYETPGVQDVRFVFWFS